MNPTAKNAKKPCKIDGCDNPHVARGWCNKHYLRWYHRRHDPGAPGPDALIFPYSPAQVIRVSAADILPDRREIVLAGQRRFDRIKEQQEGHDGP